MGDGFCEECGDALCDECGFCHDCDEVDADAACADIEEDADDEEDA